MPDERVARAAVDGAGNAGVVEFEPLAADRTLVRLHLEFEPEGFVEQAGDKLSGCLKLAAIRTPGEHSRRQRRRQRPGTPTDARLSKRFRARWGIEERDWGMRELVLRDPNGYFVTFCEPS